MLTHLRPAIVLFVLFTALTGLAYPLAVTGIAQKVFPQQANGSLIEKDGKIIGSHLIGQNFSSEQYFHGRPSATTDTDPNEAAKTVPAPYNAANSAGSNLAATSQPLIDRVKEEAAKLATDNEGSAGKVPVDLVTTSASGLDPHITPAAAEYQVLRIAKARGMSQEAVRALVAQATEERSLGLFGERRINVLKLNLALDAAARR
jgi:K+-transporting ATPase ATPase C chain